MESNDKCPLCGKTVIKGDSLCEDCRNHIDNQYTTNLLDDISTDKSVADVNSHDIKETPDALETSDLKEEEEIVFRPKSRKKRSKSLIITILVGLTIITFGTFYGINTYQKNIAIEKEQAFWDSCVVVNTPLAYAKYLVDYREGIYTSEAHNRIRDLRIKEDNAWLKVKTSSDINEYYNYLTENPTSPYIGAARIKMDSLSWIKVSKDGTSEAYLSYINNVKLGHFSGIYIDLAQDEYDYLSQIKTLEGASLDSIKNQLIDLYLALSTQDKKAIEQSFASQVNFYSDTIANSAIADQISKDIKTRKLKKVNLKVSPTSISATRDGKGYIFAKLVVNKEEVNRANKKQHSTDSIKIEMNKDKKITAITVK